MRNQNDFKQPVQRTCQAVFYVLELVAFVAVPFVTYGWSDRYRQQEYMKVAAQNGSMGLVAERESAENYTKYSDQFAESLEDNVNVVEAESGGARNVLLKHYTIKGIINTGAGYPLEKYLKVCDEKIELPNPGEIPALYQFDERWAADSYGDSDLKTSGCGPTCLSMVIVGLTGDCSVTPSVVADYAEKNHFYEAGSGSKWTLMTIGAGHFGICGKEQNLDKTLIIRDLNEGKPIICSMGPGDFTSEGHFIVLTHMEGDYICVNDPNSRMNTESQWTYEMLEHQIVNLWCFSLGE